MVTLRSQEDYNLFSYIVPSNYARSLAEHVGGLLIQFFISILGTELMSRPGHMSYLKMLAELPIYQYSHSNIHIVQFKVGDLYWQRHKFFI